MLLTAGMIDAILIERRGIVNKIIPKHQLGETTMALANTLVEKRPLDLTMGKWAFFGISDMEFMKTLKYTKEVFTSFRMTQHAREWVDAFLKKQKPVWIEE